MKEFNIKRLFAGFLALLMLFMNIFTNGNLSYAASGKVGFDGKNIWKGKEVVILGHKRHYLFKWKTGNTYTFCIEEGQHMGRNVKSSVNEFSITDDNIPYLGSDREMFRNLALISSWVKDKSKGLALSDADYAAAQISVWMAMRSDIEGSISIANQIRANISGDVVASTTNLLKYVEEAKKGINLGNGIYASEDEAKANPINMELVDGIYKASIDLSKHPELKGRKWEAPQNFIYEYSGNNLVISYEGEGSPNGVLQTEDVPISLQKIISNSETLTIYIPDNEKRNQAMISASADFKQTLYINLGGTTAPTTEHAEVEVEVYKHSETFNSTYNVALEKYDYETRKPLEGVSFDVLESFDESQLGDGENATLSSSNMTPKPSTWSGFRKFGEVLTDSEGKASFSDKRYYDYEKIYVGHPQPEYLKVPEAKENEDGTNNGEEIAAVEAENERLRKQYEAIVELCEEKGYFHDDDIEVAKAAMLEDRDSAYNKFINLKYKYTFKETKTREGYILHGKHNDDEPIEVIETNSSEAGANTTVESVSADEVVVNSFSKENDIVERENRNLLGAYSEEKPSIIKTFSLPIVRRADLTLKERSIKEDTKLSIDEKENKNSLDEVATPSRPKSITLNTKDSFFKKSLATDLEKATDSDSEIVVTDDINFNTFSEDNKESFINFGTDSDDKDSDDSISINFELPEPEEDDEAFIGAGDGSKVAHIFRVYNNRTEGEIHINKRDMELFNKDKENSYGKAQGDATLEGAVYGLYAASDIIHPDGKTGVVYKAGDLVAIASTDKKGDASFLAYTRESETSLTKENKYGTWVGRPLILGSYYVKEISRSEGYELSVSGKNLKESNRNTTKNEAGFLLSAEVRAGNLSHPIDEHDGSTNDVDIKYYKTENGFKLIVNGYPKGTKFYKVNIEEKKKIEKVVKDTYLATKTDALGKVVYKKAEGGELKFKDGKPIELVGEESTTPESEVFTLKHRLNLYPSGTLTPTNFTKWEEAVDTGYLVEELNTVFKKLGYKELDKDTGTGSPWLKLNLEAGTNKELGEKILKELEKLSFYDSAIVHSIEKKSGKYEVKLFVDYKGQSGSAFFDNKSKKVYIKKPIKVAGVDNSHIWLSYDKDSYSFRNFTVSITPKKEITQEVRLFDEVDTKIKTVYQKKYERYVKGDNLLDDNGNPIAEKEIKYIYADEEQVSSEESLEEIHNAIYDESTGTYTLDFANTIDWSNISEKQQLRLRLQTKEKEIEVDGNPMYYSDYLTKIKGAGVSAISVAPNLDEGSYINYTTLTYPGQIQVFSDANTRNEKLQVLERVIKQAIKVTKSVSKVSYNENNTYKIHKDPFTVLFGGYKKDGKEFVKGFKFKLYLVSDLEKENLLEKNADGSYNYKKLFYDESKKEQLNNFAINWDKPEKNTDGDLTTITAELGNSKETYFGSSIMLPYGRYVIVEQVPSELVNKHYEVDEPKEIDLPFVPEIENGSVHDDIASKDYIYRASYTPEELVEKFRIRFNEESEVIKAHSHDGDFEIYPYGLKKDLFERAYTNATVGARYKYGQSENSSNKDSVYYEYEYDNDGNIIDYGTTKENVPTMIGKSEAVNGKYAKALVPYTILDPRYGEVVNDKGDIGNRDGGLDKDGKFNFIAFLKSHFENTFYSSKLRIEKLDFETGENIIHEGALFKIYAAKRDISAKGTSDVNGSGRVLFETKEIKGRREDLEARGDVDNITYNEEEKTYIGSVTSPDYDENEQIFLKNDLGNEVGIFKAYSTESEVIKADGTVSKEKLGYIETFSPLGAGAYVLVEVDAPKGYQKSKPIAFEVYKDETNYYENGESSKRVKAERFQYVKPLTSAKETLYTDTAKIVVNDKPSTMRIHKVEDGDAKIGDVNGLDKLSDVNDKGDLLTYIVKGRKEYLKARGDVEDIKFNEKEKIYYGTVTKAFDEWCENLIIVDEKAALTSENMKPLYDKTTGAYSGYAIRFDKYVANATMTLYEGLELEKLGFGNYKGVSVEKENGKTVKIVANSLATGNHSEITRLGKDTIPPYLPIYDVAKHDNESIELYFYDTSTLKTEIDKGEVWALDDKGNRLSYVDLSSGLAYTKDDYGKIIAYKSKNNKKIIAKSINIKEEADGSTKIYENLESEKDENNLVKYYIAGNVNLVDEVFITDSRPHTIKRLPFGAYILEESKVPYESGYIKVADKGLILRVSSEVQDFYYQNVFTKLNIAKIDISTKKEIPDATMTLFRANRVADDSKKGYHLEKGEVYTKWISGYEYDDRGNIKLENGKPIKTTKPHFIDHIPVGHYILEETIVPYKDGYVKSEDIEIEVKESGNVQTAFMEDDYTALEIKKYDTKTNKVLDNLHRATLSLYKANVDKNGKEVLKKTVDSSGKEVEQPSYEKSNLIVTWNTDDGTGVEASGRVVTNEYGETYTKYDYNKIKIKGQTNAYYYITENGTTRFDYLPVGKYVLVEGNIPIGYATANDMLIDIKDIGSKKEVAYYEMGDVPLRVNVHKQNLGKIVKDATLEIYKMGKDGVKEEKPMYSFITGSDGVYTEADAKEGKIPEGYKIGDLKPHLIEYIPLGKYVLVEKITPFGFIKADDKEFEIVDTPNIQNVHMEDEIPKGSLNLIKLDSESKKLLKGAKFSYKNKTTGEVIEELVTDESGKAEAKKEVPIGYLGNDGYFKSYTYEVVEIDAPDDYMLNTLPHEFIYEYKDEDTISLTYTYDALNDINQVKISKIDLTSKKELEGAKLKVYEKATKKLVDEWVSTKEVHYIKGLKEGKYILEEIATPEHGNYAKAENIEFEIVKNMTGIPFVEMFDDSSKVEIKKVDGSTGLNLEGAKLSLKDENGKVLYEWVSSKENYQISGLKAGNYYIGEAEAPKGYEKSSDVKIEVKDTLEKQEFIFNNYRFSSGGGGNLPNRRYITFKKIDDKGMPLANVEFSFYKADGSLLKVATSDSKGIIKIERPANGTYTFKETKGLDGYYKNDKTYILEVSESGVKADFDIVNVALKEVVVLKKDLKTDKLLAGAKLKVTTPKNDTLTLISNENGEFRFVAKELGDYILEEIEAPKGYKKSNAKYRVNVGEDGKVTGDRVIYNANRKVGKIIFRYKKNLTGNPKTGDTNIEFFYILVLSLSLILSLLLLKFRNKRKFMILILMIGTLINISANNTYAIDNKNFETESPIEVPKVEDSSSNGILELTDVNTKIKLEPIREKLYFENDYKTEVKEYNNNLEVRKIGDRLKEKFDKEIDYKGKKYKLVSIKNKSLDPEIIHKTIEQEIIYKNLETDFDIPKFLDIKLIKDYGFEEKELNVNLILKDIKKENFKWDEDFKADMLVYDYDADEFLLGNSVIEKNNILLLTKEKSNYILNSLNLDENSYKILGLEWKGREKIIDSSLCREAVVYGKKRTCNMVARYSLDINLDKKPKYENVASYEIFNEDKNIAKVEVMKEGLLDKLLALVKTPVGIGLAILLLFVSIFLLVFRREMRKD